MLCWSCEIRPATGSANRVELPTRALSALGAISAGSRPLSSLVSVLSWLMDVETAAALSCRKPLTPMSHQNSPWAPSTIAITAWLRSSLSVGIRELLVNLKNCRTVQIGRLAGTAARCRAVKSATMKCVYPPDGSAPYIGYGSEASTSIAPVHTDGSRYAAASVAPNVTPCGSQDLSCCWCCFVSPT